MDASVGKAAANSDPCDISYVQWYYTLAAAHPHPGVAAERRAIYKRVSVTGACTGIAGDPLVDAITAHQQHLAHPQIDGWISVARPGVRIGPKTFFILRLGAYFADMHPRYWPRLDYIPGCPPIVAAAVKATIPHIDRG